MITSTQPMSLQKKNFLNSTEVGEFIKTFGHVTGLINI